MLLLKKLEIIFPSVTTIPFTLTIKRNHKPHKDIHFIYQGTMTFKMKVYKLPRITKTNIY